MVNFAEQLERYFTDTPKEVLEREWSELEPLNEIGPDVLEYAERVRECFGVLETTTQLSLEQTEPFNSNEQYYLAA